MNASTKSSLKRIGKYVGFLFLALLTVIIITGFIPLSIADLEATPQPITDYQTAVNRFEEILTTEAPIVNEISHSVLMTHGQPTDVVYVLIHGTTNSPYQFEELGEQLHARGHNVLIMRMPYHGLKSHRVDELKNLKVEDLRAYADETVDLAVGLGQQINVMGISGGGAVATWIAQNRPEVNQVLPLSPFFGTPAVPQAMNTYLLNILARAPNIVLDVPLEPRRDWVYRGEATRGVVEFLRLGRFILAKADQAIPEPQVNFVITDADTVAANDYTRQLAAEWQESNAQVSLFVFESALDIPHNSIDPAADSQKKSLVYDKILEIFGEAVD